VGQRIAGEVDQLELCASSFVGDLEYPPGDLFTAPAGSAASEDDTDAGHSSSSFFSGGSASQCPARLLEHREGRAVGELLDSAAGCNLINESTVLGSYLL
jgi:hypothetical protein